MQEDLENEIRAFLSHFCLRVIMGSGSNPVIHRYELQMKCGVEKIKMGVDRFVLYNGISIRRNGLYIYRE